jgi:hypothetical protein
MPAVAQGKALTKSPSLDFIPLAAIHPGTRRSPKLLQDEGLDVSIIRRARRRQFSTPIGRLNRPTDAEPCSPAPADQAQDGGG